MGAALITPLYLSLSMVCFWNFVGHVLFDGWLYMDRKRGKYVVGYSNKSQTLISQFISGTRVLYKVPYVRLRSNGVKEVELYSKRAYYSLLEAIGNIDNYLFNDLDIIQFLRAFWDDEGTISTSEGSLKLRARQNKMLDFLVMLHRKIGVPARIDYNGKGIVISGRKNICLFSRLIGFSRGVYVGKSRTMKNFGREKWVLLRQLLKGC